MPIEQLDVIPSRYRPSTFTPDMEAFLAWIQRNVPNYNALEQSLQLVATTGTSSSTLTVGTGVRNLAAPAGKAWAVGSWVVLAYAGGVSNLMLGQITAYNSTSGAMTVDVKSSTGTGTYSSWVISLGAARGGSETFSGTVNAQRLEAGDTLFAALLAAGVATLQFDDGDALRYDRAANALEVIVNNAVKMSFTSSGPERPDNATTPNGLVRKSQVDAQISAQVAALNNRIDIVVPSSVSVLHGQIFHGNTLPLPDGFTEAQCRWLVSPHEYNAGYFDLQEGNAQQAPYFTCKVGAGRVVEAQTRFNIGGWVASWANYIVIGVK